MNSVLVSLFLLLTTIITKAQESCPTISVSAPTSVAEGENATFTANVSGGPNSITFNWTISAGTISGGQGTPSISVDTKGLSGRTITATIELGGVATVCNASSSSSSMVTKPAAPARLFEKGTYTTISAFNKVANKYALTKDPDGELLTMRTVIIYPGAGDNGMNAAKAMEMAVKEAMMKARVNELVQMVMIGKPKAVASYELYMVPMGATSPLPDEGR